MESGGQTGVLLCPRTHGQFHTPTGRPCTPNRRSLCYNCSHRKEEFLSVQQQAQPLKNTATQPVRNLATLNSPVLQWPSSQSGTCQLPASLSKVKFLSFDLQTCLWFAIACVSQTAVPLLFLKKTYFAGKTTGCFKVDSYYFQHDYQHKLPF